jgi:signal transduction histidine kinase
MQYERVVNSFTYSINGVDVKYEMFAFFKPSEAFIQLRNMLDGLINSFVTEIVENSESVPVLLVTTDETRVIASGNVSLERYTDSLILRETLAQMRLQNQPIEISDGVDSFLVFYESSDILRRLSFIPAIAFGVIVAFVFSLIWVMRTARRSENNMLWAGMSRETAHQLGTPLSSLIGWVEYLRLQNVEEENLVEIEKDIDRLKVIAERFSKIGSEPKMTSVNIVRVVYDSISYLQFRRLSRKVRFQVNVSKDTEIFVDINPQLVEWVFENLSTNAADAIGANEGLIQIDITEHRKTVVIDITDNGKGLPKKRWKTIFETGYTTKPRGWGLGLPLSRRIIHNYHRGKIFVKNSATGEGTTFRIIFNK